MGFYKFWVGHGDKTTFMQQIKFLEKNQGEKRIIFEIYLTPLQ